MMRPPVPDVILSRSRKSSLDQPPPRSDPHSMTPATFFLARNGSQDGDLASPFSPDNDDDDNNVEYDENNNNVDVNVLNVSPDYMYGVRSLEDTSVPVSSSPMESPVQDDDRSKESRGNEGEESSNLSDSGIMPRRRSTLRPSDLFHPLPSDPTLLTSNPTSPRPSTPSNLSNPDDQLSLPSSPASTSNHSMRHLDDISITDDLSIQALPSGEDDDRDSRPSPKLGPDHVSQLIMPSITMPSRRPFTDRGKSLGRLKLLFAGVSGSGKTSLIRSIVQTCEDIVHVDPLLSEPSPMVSHRSPSPSQPGTPSAGIAEVYASTKPYPPWWSDLEDSRVLRRRRSTGDVVLERNICFVDTPSNTLSRAGQTDAIIQYMQQQLYRASSSVHLSNHDFQNMLAGNGGLQVDAVVYLLAEDTLPTDVECIRKLCEWTNVIPVISKSDLLTADQLSSLKSAFYSQTQTAAIQPFVFGDGSPGGADGLETRVPFAVSSAKSSDDEVMDASTLMSPDYVQPLATSELDALVQQIFDADNVAWIRHSAAKKLAQRQRERPLRWTPGGGSGALAQAGRPLPTYSPPPSYAISRITDYTHQEDRLAQARLAKWACDLQRSLQNERERYAALARGDRAVWLTERLGECVVDGSLVPITQIPGYSDLGSPSTAEKTTPSAARRSLLARRHSGPKTEYHVAPISPHDPLGLIRWSEDLKRRGWTIVQIVGSFGVVGGLAVWLAQTWGLPSRTLSEWRFDY
ncbi:hypothetical protein P168DRAFT_172118 [Aspergillus campestris IBT 28561]|uniref:Septin-type G domain-containing protein n=1 Tax=Aspergillus campestris (strain IBT 28561) TaxID=1392248 RepID=A0A2I1D287_ASPC2|nr:uncharacterized protein P168DRAFT_172118 [Aspergillus campestris IBT 28561]PKY03958.1 hypothetical protein P168DRAFT_172118 [Aspergillus campestris IBT 28561]